MNILEVMLSVCKGLSVKERYNKRDRNCQKSVVLRM